MGRISILITISFLFLLNSCCIPIIQKRFYKTEEGFERPKRNGFELGKNPYNLKETDLIKTNCIYQNSFSLEYIDAKTNKKTSRLVNGFFRFFKNGRYIESAVLKEKDSLFYYNNLKRGYIGYYEIIDSKVKLEHFSVGSQDCGKYSVTYLNLNDNYIGDFKKTEVNGLTGTPDW